MSKALHLRFLRVTPALWTSKGEGDCLCIAVDCKQDMLAVSSRRTVSSHELGRDRWSWQTQPKAPRVDRVPLGPSSLDWPWSACRCCVSVGNASLHCNRWTS